MTIGMFGLKCFKNGEFINFSLSILNVSVCLFSHFTGDFFDSKWRLVKSVIGATIAVYRGMNFLKKLHNPKKRLVCFIFSGVGTFFIAANPSSFGLTPY